MDLKNSCMKVGLDDDAIKQDEKSGRGGASM